MVKKGWFVLHQFLCLCICDTFTVMKTPPNQLSICHLNNIFVKDLTYVWLCCQDLSQGKLDVVPFFELKVSQVASGSLKSPLSPKAAIPLTRRRTVLLFVSPCPLPVPGSGTQHSKCCHSAHHGTAKPTAVARDAALLCSMEWNLTLFCVSLMQQVLLKFFWCLFVFPEYMAYIKNKARVFLAGQPYTLLFLVLQCQKDKAALHT